MQFSTPRLTFRPIAIHDAEDIHQIRGREEVMKWSMKKTTDKDVSETREWLESTLSTPHGVFAIIERKPSTSSSPSSSSASASATATATVSSPDANREKVIGTIGMRLMDAPSAPFKDTYVFTSSATTFVSPLPDSSSVSASASDPTGGSAGVSTTKTPTTNSTNTEESNEATKGEENGKEKSKSKPKYPKRWELGYQFHPDTWGKGYGTEATKGILGAWAEIRAALGAQDNAGSSGNGDENGEEGGKDNGKGANADRDMVYAVTNRTNGPSRRVLEKAGFEVVGTFVDHEGTELVDHGFLVCDSTN